MIDNPFIKVEGHNLLIGELPDLSGWIPSTGDHHLVFRVALLSSSA